MNFSRIFLFAAVSLAGSVWSCGNSKQDDDGSKTGDGDGDGDQTAVTCAPNQTVGDGEPCACATDCLSGAFCTTEESSGTPLGMCMRPCFADQDVCSEGTSCTDLVEELGPEIACSGSCESDTDCGSLSCHNGACCVPGVCEIDCTTSADCPEARLCTEGVCAPHCSSDAECHNGTCNLYSGLCTETDLDLLGLSEACIEHDDCRSGYCHNATALCGSNCSRLSGVCPDGGICLEVTPDDDLGVCGLSCETKADCPLSNMDCLSSSAGSYCGIAAQGPCEPRPGAPFDPCLCDEQCSGDAFCVPETELGHPGGICLAGCTLDEDCPDGTDCSNGSYCQVPCDETVDCGGGRHCGSDNYCNAFCTNDSDCDNGACNLYSGRCTKDTASGAGLFAACSAHEECLSDFCSSGGYCLSLCSRSEASCPENALCGDSGHFETGLCVIDCAESDATCTPYGLTCRPENYCL